MIHPSIAYQDAFGTVLLLFIFTLTLFIKSRHTYQQTLTTLIPFKFTPRQPSFQRLSFWPGADWKVPSSKCILLLIIYFSIRAQVHCKLLFIHGLKLLEFVAGIICETIRLFSSKTKESKLRLLSRMHVLTFSFHLAILHTLHRSKDLSFQDCNFFIVNLQVITIL